MNAFTASEPGAQDFLPWPGPGMMIAAAPRNARHQLTPALTGGG